MDNLETLKSELMAAVKAATTLDALEATRVSALGKKGRVSEMMKGLGALEPDERRDVGFALNRLKDQIADAIEERKRELTDAAIEARLATETIDVTLPPRPDTFALGRVHPISQTLDEIVAILGEMGFAVAEGPDIEDDFHNFTALNIPPNHPARQMHDTFYLPRDKNGEIKLLRTHTSPVQIRTMQKRTPPLRIIAPGRTYRCDSDMTHTPMFHQVEGLVIDKTTHMGHLKGCLIDFCRAYFEIDDLPLRFRASFFPFTEPSAEVDIGCVMCAGSGRQADGAGCRVCKRSGWLEILGSGLIDPNVFRFVGYDPEQFSGFAFGLGVERLAMLKHGIDDIRLFYENDLRFLRQF
jgi:phenylalanyl-tRNA synthetase alpha chain